MKFHYFFRQVFGAIIEYESFQSVLPVQQGNSWRNNNSSEKGDPRMVCVHDLILIFLCSSF